VRDATANLYDDGSRRTHSELRTAGLPHCTPEAIGCSFVINEEHRGHPEAEAAHRDATDRLAAYLVTFLPPGPCVRCGATLGGNETNMLAMFLGTFRWGLAHGEGTCSRCGYPARALHEIELGDCGKMSLPRILQYHPDTLEER
jgi:hypothetical protein